MTAREDQPQLGTCDNEPEVLHVYNSRNVLCRNWRSEDQPRPTQPCGDVLLSGVTCTRPLNHGGTHWSKELNNEAYWKRATEAQGEAPRVCELFATCVHCNQRIGWQKRTADDNSCAQGYWYSRVTGSGCPKSEFGHERARVETGAHPSQDALLKLYEACRAMRQSNKVGYFNIFSPNFVRPWDKFYAALEECDTSLASGSTPSPDPPQARPYNDKWWDNHAELDKWSANLQREIERLREALRDIISEADQSNGGKGAKLPIVLHIRELARAALGDPGRKGTE